MEIIFELNEIESAAADFLRAIQNFKIIAFSGELGAGKTTFIKQLCKILGVTEEVSSPTFSIIQEYFSLENEAIYHIDLYRIKDEVEAFNAGVEDCFEGNHWCFVEWPERAPKIFASDTVYVNLQILGESKRKMIVNLPK
ncbi:MAG: tRNA (adenosine(37)-N6)-threonylcarbamoyltransferase complex ATPase subunit type 1 TsaE [Ginsengibacter sp.]